MTRHLLLLSLLVVAACGGDEPAPVTFAGRGVDAWADALEAEEGADAARAELERGGATAVPVLAGLVGRPDRPAARLVALELIARLGPEAEAAVPALTAALDDEDPALRGFVATALGRIGEAAKPALLALDTRLRDRDPGVRVMAALAIWGIARDGRTCKSVLLDAMQSNSARLRALAAGAFTELGDLAVEPLMVSLIDRDPRVRAAAAAALGQIGPAARAAVSVLREAAASDESDDVRLAARRALDLIAEGN